MMASKSSSPPLVTCVTSRSMEPGPIPREWQTAYDGGSGCCFNSRALKSGEPFLRPATSTQQPARLYCTWSRWFWIPSLSLPIKVGFEKGLKYTMVVWHKFWHVSVTESHVTSVFFQPDFTRHRHFASLNIKNFTWSKVFRCKNLFQHRYASWVGNSLFSLFLKRVTGANLSCHSLQKEQWERIALVTLYKKSDENNLLLSLFTKTAIALSL